MNADATSEWFYEVEGKQHGPVTERRIRELRELGGVSEASLVWTAGMEEWRSFATAFGSGVSVEKDDEVMEEDLVTCAFSGKKRPTSQMLPFGDQWVAPEHRTDFVQRLGEGIDEAELPIEGYPFSTGLTLSALVEQSWKIWTAQWVPMVVFSAIVWTPFTLLVEFFSYQAASESGLGAVKGQQGLEFFVGSFVNAGILGLALDRWRGGGSWTLGALFRRAGENYGKVLLTRFVLFLFLIPVGLLIGIFAIASDSIPLLVIFGVIGGVAVIYVAVRLSGAEAFALLIESGGGEAIRECWEATRGRFWQILLYRLVVYLPLVFAASLLGALGLIPILENFVGSALISIFASLAMTVGAVFEMVLALHLQANRKIQALGNAASVEPDGD